MISADMQQICILKKKQCSVTAILQRQKQCTICDWKAIMLKAQEVLRKQNIQMKNTLHIRSFENITQFFWLLYKTVMELCIKMRQPSVVKTQLFLRLNLG